MDEPALSYLKKIYQIIKRGGAKEFLRRLRAKFIYHPLKRQCEYQRFLRATRPTESELTEQRQTNFAYRPCFGVVIPLYNTKLTYLQDLLDSFRTQTYPHFKLFMVDASPAENGKTLLTDFIQAESRADSRIIYKTLAKNKGIANNTNQAINLAMQDLAITHIAFCDHDDFIEPNTFFEYAKILNQFHEVKIIYSDEDVVRFKGDPKATYVMKPDFDPYLLESCNYINHFFAVEKQLLEKVKTKDGLYEQPEYDGAQDYDLYLRLSEAVIQTEPPLKDLIHVSSLVYHLPKVLYHWRAAESSTASDPHNKIYAYNAARCALEAHFGRQGVGLESVEHTETIGTYRTKYHLKSEPLVSVIIPNSTNVANLSQTINSVQSGTYQNIEFIVTNDCSTIKNINGDILLFLDNNLEMLSPNSIAEMVAILERDNVGAVGAELLFPDNRLEHAGIIIGLEVNNGHIFYHMDPKFTYGNRANCVSSYSAISGSCLIVKKSTYDEIGGFDDKISTPLRSTDFCLKLRTLGRSIVYTPYAKFRYYKKRQGSPTSLEIEQFRKKWSSIYKFGDPYYNRNFSRLHSDCQLKQKVIS